MGLVSPAAFAQLTIPVGSTLNVGAGTLNVVGDLTIEGTLITTTGAVNLTGDWVNLTGTYTAGTGTVALTGTGQRIRGATNTFYNLTKIGGADTLTFDAGSAYAVTGALTLQGASSVSLLTLDSSDSSTQFQLALSGTQSLNFLNVNNSNATGVSLVGLNSIGTGQGNDNLDSAPRWVFGATTMTWEGDVSNDWSVNGNWDIGLVPGVADKAIIPTSICGGCVMPTLSTDAGVDRLTIQASATLTLAGNNLTIANTSGLSDSGSLSNDGNLILRGDETLSIATIDSDSGTFIYVGTNTGAMHTITDFGFTDYYNLVINDTNGTPDTFQLGSNLETSGSLTVSGGSFTAVSNDIDVNGSVTVSGGTLTAPGSGDTFTVADDWTYSGGIFTHNNGTVIFDTATTASFTGDTTFNSFTSTIAGKSLNFIDTSTQTVNGTLTLTGTDGNLIALGVIGGVGTWNIIVDTLQSVSFLNVSNSEVLGVMGDDILCVGCQGAGQGNDNAGASPKWLFLTEVTGVIFESKDNFTINEAEITLHRSSDGVAAVVGTDLHFSDINPSITTFDGAYKFRAIEGDYYIRINAAGYDYPSVQKIFPADRTVSTGSKAEVFTLSSIAATMDQPVDFNGQLLRIEKDANKSEASIGEIVTYDIEIENIGTITVSNVLIDDRIPPGFKYMKDRVILDGLPISNPSGNRPLLFSVGSFAPGDKKVLKYQLVIGSGVTVGDYNNIAVARYVSGQYLSNRSRETVEVTLDPLFDLGMVIGKVFLDLNENGVQDAPEYVHMDRDTIMEEPLANVQIAMEDGTLLTTDKNGMFHVPALTPGRHLFRLDERSLPSGSYLTTDKVVIVDVTEGASFKVNFGVNIDGQRFESKDYQFFANKVSIRQDQNKPRPRLNVAMFNNEIALYQDVFVEDIEFKIFTNYAPFIEIWKLEIIDMDTRKRIKVFEGKRDTIYNPIFWNGTDVFGKHIKTGRKYGYSLTVEGKKGRYDETKVQALSFKVIEDEKALKEYENRWGKDQEDEEEKRQDEEKFKRAYHQWMKDAQQEDKTLVQTIVIDGETITINPLDIDLRGVRIFKDGRLFSEVPLGQRSSIMAKELLVGDIDGGEVAAVDVILPKGEFTLEVATDSEPSRYDDRSFNEGINKRTGLNPVPTARYAKQIKVGEDYMFFVGLGDTKMGYNFSSGDIEPIETNDRFRDGFWREGKAAYYLKGKIKGKYLITSSFDTERQRKELFKKLDKDDYYPVYGDSGTVNYDATDTQGNLYLLVEWDKSSLKWGNYAIDFDDTEFGRFTRTLYGGKVDLESLSATPYGEPRTKVVAFRARAQQKSAHNEFLATGGSLYYFKHKDMIEGSDQIKIEVRDQITGLVLSQREMIEGTDYNMDYKSGRMIFWKPVPMLVQAYSIISDDLLQGNLVYVVADYEYEVKDNFDEATVGTRAQKALGDHVLIGGTYVKENQQQGDYQLRGTDVTVHVGENASVTAEYAQTTAGIQGTFVSTDGGLTFRELVTNDDAEGRAYGIKGNMQLFNRLALVSHYKWVDNDFSSSATTAQQGKEIFGFSAVYDMNESTRFSARHDIQNLLDGGNLQTQVQVGAQRTVTTLLQLVHEAKRLRLTAEYKNKKVTERIDQFTAQTNEGDTVAVQADYKLSDKVDISMRQQITIDGENNDQTTFGLTARPTDKLTVKVGKTVGEKGFATSLDAKLDVTGRLALTGEYSAARDKDGNITNDGKATTSVGTIYKLNEQTEIKTTVGASDVFTDTMTKKVAVSGSTQLDENTKLESGVAISDSGSTVSFGGTSEVDDKTKLTGRVEVGSPLADQTTSLTFEGTSEVDARTQTSGKVVVSESASGGDVRAVTFGTTKKLSEEVSLVSSQSFGNEKGDLKTNKTYTLARTKDGRKVEGSFARAKSESGTEISQSNIYGLTGEVNENLAVRGAFERGRVQNFDGTETERSVLSAGLGYVKKDKETGEELKSSTKVEWRSDKGDQDKRQYLVSHATEGKVTPEVTFFSKAEFSKTRNITADFTEAQHKEFMIGGAYRPIMHDRLNALGRYTYLEEKSPAGQEDKSDIKEERAHVFSVDVIYDFNEHWQISERFAYRIAEEKVSGFDFSKTHTWLMIQRLNYKVDADWVIGGEFRMLTQQEARDRRSGFLLEVARRLGEFAQLGVGYNLTDFNDDLTNLDYITQGPFVRLTGKFYDRTPQEAQRAKDRWIDEKVKRWAWRMVEKEFGRSDSPVLEELNSYFIMAEKAQSAGDDQQAQWIYKDIIMAGRMMYEEAAAYIYAQILIEKSLKQRVVLADEYFKKGQYEKAKKILEKIVEEAQQIMLE